LLSLSYLIALGHTILNRSYQNNWAAHHFNSHELSESFLSESTIGLRSYGIAASNTRGESNATKVDMLIVFGPKDDPWQKAMDQAVVEGCQGVPFEITVSLKSIDCATFQDVQNADAIIIGSRVHNANTHPEVQQWINKEWDLGYFDGTNRKVGGAFVTAGGISAGQEETLQSSLRSMMIFRMILVCGETWQSAFGAAAVTGEAPFTVFRHDSGSKFPFPRACYQKRDELISPMFLAQARGLGARVASVSNQIRIR
jgi:NAD(P)H dehydrogenase (quinone)